MINRNEMMKNIPTPKELKELEDYANWLKFKVLIEYPKRDIEDKIVLTKRIKK